MHYLAGMAAVALGAATALGQNGLKPVVAVPVANVPYPAADRQRAIDFWSQPGRYTETPPDTVKDRGLWQVRETVAGSTWVFNYNRARKSFAPPTQNSTALNPQQKAWDDWIQAKVAHDRWAAYQVASKANLQVLGTALPVPDKTIPASEPPLPGPVPSDLEALAGAPPAMAEAVVPMQHKIAFDDDTLTYVDNPRLGNPKYAYYRFAAGVMDEGKAVRDLPPDRIHSLFQLAGLGDTETHVMTAVSMLEGGFDSINTYDTGFVSAGFIQFACLREGAGSLGGMLLIYKQDKPDKFEQDFQRFGIDVQPDGRLDVIDPDTGGEVWGADAAMKIIQDKRLIAVFERAGQVSDDYIAEQIKAAKAMFYPADDPITVTIGGTAVTGKISDVIKSEAGLATLMDRKVNTGNLSQLSDVLSAAADKIHATSLADLVPYEADIVAAMKYRKDFLSDISLTQPPSSPTPLGLTPVSARKGTH